MTEETTPQDAALAAELTAAPPITFELDGKTYELPRPFSMRLWLKLLMIVKAEPTAADNAGFLLNVASHAEDVVLWATGLTVDAFRELPEADDICGKVAEQLGRELADASPFSSPRQALATLSRARQLTQGIAAERAKIKQAGGTPA